MRQALLALAIRWVIGSVSDVTEPRADRGPRAGSPRGVVDASGIKTQLSSGPMWKIFSARLFELPPCPARYRSRFCTPSAVPSLLPTFVQHPFLVGAKHQ